MKTIFNTLFIILLAFQIANAQDAPNIPTSYQLEKKEDYASYRAQVLETIIWLENTPISDQNSSIRRPAQKFVMTWLSGHPDLHPPLVQDIIQPLMEEDAKYAAILMGRFIFGEAKALMQTKEELSEVDLYLKGIEAMLNAYDTIHPKVKLRTMEKYKRMVKKGKLRAWLEGLVKG
ncbi:hypothetical protein [Aureispira anguillae]|uniref:HEAT repeat domain-containing protein n=1 Tax=Aureispira anguillae TaxID=2864201 RepID=A0A916DPZ5_9BACT|nr:hypothetical protein [Aureispira anguillae]BDS10431.1 hypothetical protein AsAng_0011390 [Aureispira anguillae]